jgi:hypothetical protein
MKLTFEDANGRNGVVSDDLTIRYDGFWEDDVRERVRTVGERYRTPDDEVLGEGALRTLLIELPEERPVVEARPHRE